MGAQVWVHSSIHYSQQELVAFTSKKELMNKNFFCKFDDFAVFVYKTLLHLLCNVGT